MKRAVYHIVWSSRFKCWRVKLGSSYVSVLVYGKAKPLLIRAVKALAKENEPSQVVIHKQNGKIQIEYTYPRETDPRRFRG